MTTILTESKSNLAKLMAEEGIIVEQREGVPTAFFDTERRLLVVPTLKDDVSSNVVDLFITHEVSHSLYTPQNWSKLSKEIGVKTSILNVVEDCRVEKLIKHKYPGLRSVHSKAYKELMDIDFFGLSEMDFEEINLADKINLNFKIGFHPQISFDSVEQDFVSRIEKITTFDEVLVIAKEIQEYMRKKYEDQIDSGDLDVDDYDPFGMSEESEDGEEGEFELGESSRNGLRPISLEEDFEGKKQKLLEELLESLTDANSSEKMQELFSESNKKSLYVDVPDIKLKDYVVDYSVVYSRLRKAVSPVCINQSAYNVFKRDNASSVSFLVKEFMLKKNAEGRKKVKISKSGDLNLNKIFAYRTSDDIFKRSEIVPKSQSHGLVFFLDWSGSMDNYINDTIKQLIAMIMFCKKLGIPFEVYAFTTSYYKVDENGKPIYPVRSNQYDKLYLDYFHLMNIFSSRMPNNQFIEACNFLLSYNGGGFTPDNSYRKQYNRWNYANGPYADAPCWFNLGNTPLDHSIFVSKQIMEEFKERTKVQKAHCIFMTDGDSHAVEFMTMEGDYVRHANLDNHYNYNIYVRDRKTGVSHKIVRKYPAMNETNNCIEFLKKNSDFNVFGFRLIDSREFKKCYYAFNSYESNYVEQKKKFDKDNCVRSTSTAFDEFYLVKSNSINDKIAELNVEENDTQASIAKKFQKNLTAKVNGKVFLKRFIEFIS